MIGGFCFDARQVKPGDCFVALSGGARDGHEFISQALAGGAVAALVEKVSEVEIPQLLVPDTLLALGRLGGVVRQAFQNPVVGITGSCGKTSTKEMLRLLLGGMASVHATAGNWNNRIGVPMTLLPLDTQQHGFAVIEAGINQPGEMELLGEMIQSDLTIVTNIGPAHLELLGDLQSVAREKSQLALRARENAPIILPYEVLDYTAFAALADRAIVLCAEGAKCELPVRRVVYYTMQFTESAVAQLQLREGAAVQVYSIHTSSSGMVQNAALAILAARELGVGELELQTRIADWRPSSNRGRVATQGEQTFYVDCYNANPASMRDALTAFEASVSAEQSRIYVLGAMNELGGQAPSWHTSIGRSLKLRAVDRAYFIGPEALTEAYAAGALQAGAQSAQIRCVEKCEILKSEIAELPGALFLKGSRAYALEKLLPDTL